MALLNVAADPVIDSISTVARAQVCESLTRRIFHRAPKKQLFQLVADVETVAEGYTSYYTVSKILMSIVGDIFRACGNRCRMLMKILQQDSFEPHLYSCEKVLI